MSDHVRDRGLAVRAVSAMLLLGASFVVWGPTGVGAGGERLLSVTFLDVGQGDATFIQAPNGAQVLIDGGREGSVVLRELGSVMPLWDRDIDVVIATHPDQDHIGGLPAVIERYVISHALVSGARSETDLDEALDEALAREGATVHVARRGERIWLDEERGVLLEMLYPNRDMSEERDTNDASIVARLVYGDHVFLFTGDASRDIEEYLVWLDSDSVEADVLKVGHHGSRTSTSRIFLSWVDPDHAVISAGKDNPYGHPHEEVVALLTHQEVEVHETAHEGRVRFTSDGVVLSVSQK